MPANVLSVSPTAEQTQTERFFARHRRKLAAVAAAGALFSTACIKEPVLVVGPATSTPGEATTGAKTTLTATQAKHVGQAVLLPGSKHTVIREVSLPTGQDSFRDFMPMSEPGPKIPVGSRIEVDCYMFNKKQYDKGFEEDTTRGVFYHILGSPDVAGLEGYYTVANAHENDSNGRTDNRYDPAVPLCPGSPSGATPAPLH